MPTPLTETALKAVKPAEKAFKLFDGRGLFLFVPPSGARLWRMKYRYGGREKLLAIGEWPHTSLKRARDRLNEARQLLADGIDPAAKKKAEREAVADTFAALAKEYLDTKRSSLKPKTLSKAQWLLDDWLNKYAGKIPLRHLKAADILSVCRRIEAKGLNETAHRARALASRVMRYGVITGRVDRDPCADLRGALTPVKTKNHAAITDPIKVGELLRAIDGYEGQPSTAFALKLAPYVFARPGELRAAAWSEFELEGDQPVWRIPAERMKMGEQHIIPLARQVVAILKQLQLITGDGPLLFPSLRSKKRPISDNTVNGALRRLGYSHDQHTGHGFRSTASTLLNEHGWNPDLIELQLAHAERNKVRSAYNRAERLSERRTMMQAWADYLDSLKTDSSHTMTLKRHTSEGLRSQA
jgi:integrase